MIKPVSEATPDQPQDLAVVICMHANPALGMSTLISLLLQDMGSYAYDIHFIYNVGPDREYPEMEGKGFNRQLSPYDTRVEDITQVSGKNTYRWYFQNDHALDSGAWWKWIMHQDAPYKNYRYVWFCGEGFLFSSRSALRDTLAFADKEKAHFISPGHEKRWISRDLFLRRYNHKNFEIDSEDAFHNKMIEKVISVFDRDPDFSALTRKWELLPKESVGESQEIIMEYQPGAPHRFEEERHFKWYGCSSSNFFSLDLTSKIVERSKEYNFLESIELPYSGTAYELVWAFFPSAYGFKKYFTDASYRPRKQKPFNPYKMRVDTPEGYSRFLRKYFGREVSVKPVGDFVKIVKLADEARVLREALPGVYFASRWERDPLDLLGLSHLKIYSRRDWLFVKGRLEPTFHSWVRRLTYVPRRLLRRVRGLLTGS